MDGKRFLNFFVCVFVVTICRQCTSTKSTFGLERQKYFKKINDIGDSLAFEDIISSHIVYSKVECSLKCLEEQSCVGYNYKKVSEKKHVNCQLGRNTTLERDTETVRNAEWVFYQDLVLIKVDDEPAIFPSFSDDDEWTLIARFSNSDSKNWMTDDGLFWYDKVTSYGDVNNSSGNTDMISAAFWELKGKEIKITRTDDSTHTALLQTTSNCLQGQTFRSKITSYGDFRNATTWSSNKCLGSCPVTYGGQYQTTIGFSQHSCHGNLQSTNNIGFWCDWYAGDGAVLMIGGGGSGCDRADHGIGVTEENNSKFGTSLGFDFGNDARATTPTYSLNLWVR